MGWGRRWIWVNGEGDICSNNGADAGQSEFCNFRVGCPHDFKEDEDEGLAGKAK